MVFCLVSWTAAQASVLVDTGHPDGPTASTVSSYQGLAAALSDTQPYHVTQVEGFLRKPEVDGNSLMTLALYADDAGGQIPGTELYTTRFKVGHAGDPRYAFYSWQGISGLAWNLPAGRHWISFEVRTGKGDNYSGGMIRGCPNPLGDEAWYGNSGSAGVKWSASDDVNIGVRISGDGMPEPSSLALLGAGALVLYFYRRRIG